MKKQLKKQGLAAAYNAAMKEQQAAPKNAADKPQKPTKNKRLNFMVDEDFMEDLKALSFIKNKTLTAVFMDCVEKEIEENRKQIDMIRASRV